MAQRILAVDNDENFLKTLKQSLSLRGYIVDMQANPLEVMAMLENQYYNCILLDVKMPGMDGMELLPRILDKHPLLPVIMVSGASTIQIAVQTMKDGAYDFFVKGDSTDKLTAILRHAVEWQNLLQENRTLSEDVRERYRMIGSSPALRQLFDQIRRVAPTDATVLITSEHGTGKELVARAIYQSSRRKATSFIKVNCAAIPAELLESELFGHRKGAFTGAVSDRTGRFQAAHRGTLFLDEIGDMALGLQAKLLRVLENEEIEIVGENISRPVDVRIIAATNRELETLIQQRHFREDLYYRLKVVTLRVPALRERPEDILPLAYHFLKVYREENNRKIQRIERAGEMMLVNYPWPGNVRELRNLLEGLVIFSDEPVISAREVREALLAGTEAPPPGEQNKMIPLTEALNQFERDFLIRALTQCDWRIAETARLLDIDRASLFRKMKKFGIKRPPSH